MEVTSSNPEIIKIKIENAANFECGKICNVEVSLREVKKGNIGLIESNKGWFYNHKTY